jgi:hypothetical protein
MNNSSQPTLFCRSQRLSMLRERTGTRPFLSGERFWEDRHAERLAREEAESPWQELPRDDLVASLIAGGEVKRLAVVCAAGLGKSTNLRWLAKELVRPGSTQVPFFFALDDPDLPDSPREFWNVTLPDAVRLGRDNSDLADHQILSALKRYRALGRLTLLLDSIDQASERGLKLLRRLLAADDWRDCPIVVTARPHAVFDGWDRLIVPDERAWRFVRVEPLAEPERGTLLGQDGLDRYARLPPGGRELMANPRNIEYVRRCPPPDGRRRGPEPAFLSEYSLHHLRTASHVFAGAAEHLVACGMSNPKARTLGRRNKQNPPDHASPRQVQLALDLLGALAYTMYCQPAPGQRAGDGPFHPNVSHVPAAGMPRFTKAVLKRLRSAGVVSRRYTLDDLDDDLDALAALNAEIKFDLLDTRPHRRGDFRWYDRSLQEFFAAWWLSRYADERDRERLRQWRYDDPRDDAARTLHAPLWGFLNEMPRAVRINRKWIPAVGVLFEPGAPRCCEMIYRSWPGLSRSRAGRQILSEWQQEFARLLDDPGPRGEVARQIPVGFRPCPPDPDRDEVHFLMGSPEEEAERYDEEFQHPVTLSPFQMHRFPVTNSQYELFDPGHTDERWDGPHPAGDEADNHPVVKVTWFQAWCFSLWTGNHLPTEAQWEYSCRGGASFYLTFHYGDSLSSDQANFHGNYPYKANKGPYREHTTRVGSFEPNGFGLYDLHGNVCEWCLDWYAEDFYNTRRATRRDPQNTQPASVRVLRGGSWVYDGGGCRSADRDGREPDRRARNVGFRLAAVPVVGAQPGL